MWPQLKIITMEKKYVLILVAMFISTLSIGQELTLKAFFMGFDNEYQSYSFEDADGVTVEFDKVNSKVMKKFNLDTQEFLDEAFLITYTIIEIAIEDEDSEDLQEESSIIKLKPIRLKKNINSAEDPDADEE
jgi:hypothetical protein